MSDLGILNKLTKWVILRKEKAYNEAIEAMSDLSDRAIQLRLLCKEHEESLSKIYVVHNIFRIVVLGISIVSALLTTFGLIK